jgi:hypothetical protein
LGFDVKTNKTNYSPGETVVIELIYENISPDILTIEKMPPILSVMNSETGEPVYTFAAGKNTRSLSQGESVTFTYSWDQKDFDGRVVGGKYYIELEDLEYQGQTLKFYMPQPAGFEITGPAY